MGWSARTDACNTADAIEQAGQIVPGRSADGYRLSPSNSWIDDAGCYCFWDTGREQRDGAITGTVYATGEPVSIEVQNGARIDGLSCRAVGSVRIEPNGYPTRWTRANKAMRAIIKRERAIHAAFAGGASFAAF